MNNEELKIKIAAILQSRPFENGPCRNVEIGYITALDIADALIAAGIGDVKETEHRVNVLGRTLAIMKGKGLISGVVDDYIVQAEEELLAEENNEKPE